MHIYANSNIRQFEGVMGIEGFLQISQGTVTGIMGHSRSKLQESKK